MANNKKETQPITTHLTELRNRMIKCFIGIGIFFVGSYFFKEELFNILVAPLKKVMNTGDKLIYTGLPEAFFTYIKTSLITGIMLASPIIIYQFWVFIAPGLYKNEKKVLIPIVFLSSFFFLAGSSFGYFLVFPLGFKFFLSFTTDTISALPSMKEYLSFASKLLLAFGLAFELPLVLTFLAKLGIVSVDFLKKKRKYAILLFFLGGAILTPPDVVTQVMMAVPLMLLYEISIIGAKIFSKQSKKAKKTKEQKEVKK
jgi:sec-independent protein translocase protein TatC